MKIKDKIEKVLNDNPYSIHPSHLKEWQLTEAIKILAEEIDLLRFTNEYDLDVLEKRLNETKHD